MIAKSLVNVGSEYNHLVEYLREVWGIIVLGQESAALVLSLSQNRAQMEQVL